MMAKIQARKLDEETQTKGCVNDHWARLCATVLRSLPQWEKEYEAKELHKNWIYSINWPKCELSGVGCLSPWIIFRQSDSKTKLGKPKFFAISTRHSTASASVISRGRHREVVKLIFEF